MATPSVSHRGGGESPSVAVLRRSDRRRAQREAAYRAAQRRRMVWTDVEGPTEDSVTERVVLQKDFAQVVSSPTAGYVAVEVVIDPVTHAISIYVPP